MNDFPKGAWGKANLKQDGWSVYAQHIFICAGLNKDTANLIATAGNTANALAEQGIDAIKATELLPELIKFIPEDVYNSNPTAVDALYVRGEQE